jgi:DNA-binding NarL/FixJ family response regulator
MHYATGAKRKYSDRKVGARAYVAKSRAAEDLVKAIQAAVKGDDFVFVE